MGNAGASLRINPKKDFGLYFSGGANWWFKERLGLRFEVRDNVWTDQAAIHYVGLRIGLTFR